MTNPFDDDSAQFLVVANDFGEYALWLAGAAVPDGWDTIGGPRPRGECLDQIERTWTGSARAAGAPGGFRPNGREER